ncbi:MAG: hypothetical protein ACC651_18135 [Candidatus Scalindua sp.]
MKQNLEPFLNEKGFIYSDGQFKREDTSGIRSIISFDNMGIDNNSFNVGILINSVELDDDQGAHCVTFFTGGSLSKKARKLSCKNSEVLKSRLKRFIDLYDEIVESYISSFKTCSDIADELSNDEGLSGYRGDLYLLSGKKRSAKKAYKEWLAYLPTMKHLDKDTTATAISTTKEKIRRCSLFSRS